MARMARMNSRMRGAGCDHSMEKRFVMCGLIWLPSPSMKRPFENTWRSLAAVAKNPLRGVARQIDATARLKAEFPNLVFVGSAYSYLQEWLPNVAQYNVRNGLVDVVGLGRVALSYPDLPADVLSGKRLRRAAICRTFSDCTTGPRMGMVSGCFPLDPFYEARPEAARIRAVRVTSRV